MAPISSSALSLRVPGAAARFPFGALNLAAFVASPLAADFLASHRLAEIACLIADVQMPAMTELEPYRHFIGAGYAIPTILVTAYPDDDVRPCALNEGVVCYLRKPVDQEHLSRCVRRALHSGYEGEENS